MNLPRYSARIGEAHRIGVDVPYRGLLLGLMAFTVRAAVARCADESDWEHEQLRRNGLSALQLSRDDKALWDDTQIFTEELAEARREGVGQQFQAQNELDPAFFERLDRDLRSRWGRLGYQTPSLRVDMKTLFLELERDVADRTTSARERMLAEFLQALQESP